MGTWHILHGADQVTGAAPYLAVSAFQPLGIRLFYVALAYYGRRVCVEFSVEV